MATRGEWTLDEMQLPYEVRGMNCPAHDPNTADYRRFNPFERIPSIDDDGIVLSESADIFVYLAKKSGRLMPVPGEPYSANTDHV